MDGVRRRRKEVELTENHEISIVNPKSIKFERLRLGKGGLRRKRRVSEESMQN